MFCVTTKLVVMNIYVCSSAHTQQPNRLFTLMKTFLHFTFSHGIMSDTSAIDKPRPPEARMCDGKLLCFSYLHEITRIMRCAEWFADLFWTPCLSLFWDRAQNVLIRNVITHCAITKSNEKMRISFKIVDSMKG